MKRIFEVKVGILAALLFVGSTAGAAGDPANLGLVCQVENSVEGFYALGSNTPILPEAYVAVEEAHGRLTPRTLVDMTDNACFSWSATRPNCVPSIGDIRTRVVAHAFTRHTLDSDRRNSLRIIKVDEVYREWTDAVDATRFGWKPVAWTQEDLLGDYGKFNEVLCEGNFTENPEAVVCESPEYNLKITCLSSRSVFNK